MAASCSPLFRLPPELRNQIYEQAKAAIVRDPEDQTGIIDGIIVSHPLTRTCRQIRHESLALFQDTKYISHIQAQVFDFRFGSLLAVIEAMTQDGNEYEGIHSLYVDVHLAHPTKQDLEALRAWLHARDHSPSQQYVVTEYTVDFNWTKYDVETAEELCKVIKEKKTPGRPDQSMMHFEAHMAMTRRQDELKGGKGHPLGAGEAS